WCEKPLPVQADFLVRRLAAMVEQDPALRERQPWKAAAARDYAWLGAVITKHYRGDDADLNALAAGLLPAHAGSTAEEFERIATEFLRTARNPKLDRPYTACAFLPMVELLTYLRDNGFTNFIASGGGRDFVRAISRDCYGIPPECVIGSSVTLEYREQDG